MRNYELLPSEKAILKMAMEYNKSTESDKSIYQNKESEKINSQNLCYKPPKCNTPCSPKELKKKEKDSCKPLCPTFNNSFFFMDNPPCPPHPCPEPSLYKGKDDGFCCPPISPPCCAKSSIKQISLAIGITKSIISTMEFLTESCSVNIQMAEFIIKIQCANLKIFEELYFTMTSSPYQSLSVKGQNYIPDKRIIRELVCMHFKLMDILSSLAKNRKICPDKICELENNLMKCLLFLNYLDTCC